MNTHPRKIVVFTIAIAAFLPMQNAFSVEPPSAKQRLPSKPVNSTAVNPNAANAGSVDVVKLQLAELKTQIASAQAKIQEQATKIEELKKEIAGNKQEAKFTTTVLTTGVNKMGEDLKSLTSDFKGHTHNYTLGNGFIAAGSLFSSLKQNPNYDVTLVTSNGKADGTTGPPKK